MGSSKKNRKTSPTEKGEKLTKEEMKAGFKKLMKNKKVFGWFIAMVAYFFLIDILEVFRVVNPMLGLVLMFPIAIGIVIVYLSYINKHSDDNLE